MHSFTASYWISPLRPDLHELKILPPGLPRQQALRTLAEAFTQAGIASAHEDARILLLAAAGISRTQLISDPELPLDAAACERLTLLARRRLAREPVSRILGRREFWGLQFAVSGAVLDPRPDSESVIEAGWRALAGRRTRRCASMILAPAAAPCSARC